MAIFPGTPEPDVYFGTDDDDRISGLGGADNLWGHGGNDILDGGDGDDSLRGGDGDDLLSGGSGQDQLIGDAGNDVLYGADGDDWLHGLDGRDTLSGNGGNDLLDGGADDDRLYGGDDADVLRGGVGDDLVEGGSGDDYLDGGDGADRINGGDGFDVLSWRGLAREAGVAGIVLDLRNLAASSAEVLADTFSGIEAFEGTSGDDTLLGTDGADRLHGAYGNDLIRGRGGDDVIRADEFSAYPSLGASPALTLAATAGSRLFGDGGDDLVAGNGQTALVSGGAGNDVLSGGLDIRGGRGHDTIHVSDRDDTTVTGGAGNDLIVDSYGHDQIDAGAGRDIVVFDGVHSRSGDADIANAGAGRDLVVYVTAVDDGGDAVRLDGGAGFDVLDLNWTARLFNAATGREVVDFRLQKGGTWLDLGDVQVRNFEEIWYRATMEVRVTHFGGTDDHYRGGLSNHGDVYAYGHGGDDFLDSGDHSTFHLYGGSGNDRIVADGGSAAPHRAFGQKGDDLLFGRYMATEGTGETRLFGGAGADGFVFNDLRAGTNGPADRIMDFDPDKDWIGLNFNGYSAPDHLAINPETTTRTTLNKTLLADTDEVLRFRTISEDDGGARHADIIAYDKRTGRLTQENDTGDLSLIAKLIGAPDLTLDHFQGLTTISLSGHVVPGLATALTWDVG